MFYVVTLNHTLWWLHIACNLFCVHKPCNHIAQCAY